MAGPKQKSHRGAAKRFRVTGSGKFKHRHSGRQHNFGSKNAKRSRSLRREGLASTRDEARLNTLLPYSK